MTIINVLYMFKYEGKLAAELGNRLLGEVEIMVRNVTTY